MAETNLGEVRSGGRVKVHRLVLTGGPCGGKTTGQARLTSFFESLGWKVYRVPETATILMGGGIKFLDLTKVQAFRFQENLIKTMMSVERSFFDLVVTQKTRLTSPETVPIIVDGSTSRPVLSDSTNARANDVSSTGGGDDNKENAGVSGESGYGDGPAGDESPTESVSSSSSNSNERNVLYICDRGVLDATAYMSPHEWRIMKRRNGWRDHQVRELRYDQVIHLVSAAIGAEEFYTTDDHITRFENKEMAVVQDNLAAKAWIGHPVYDVIDNTTGFEMKMQRLIQTVCSRLGIVIDNWPAPDSLKRKFLVSQFDEGQVHYEEFECIHNYLVTPNSQHQARIRRRGQKGLWTYTHTIRRPDVKSQKVELKRNVSGREYLILLNQIDSSRASIYMKRRCFVWKNQYFKLDFYQRPCPRMCENLCILTTHTCDRDKQMPLPPFLHVTEEITADSAYSMFNLSHVHNENALVNGNIAAEFVDKSISDSSSSSS